MIAITEETQNLLYTSIHLQFLLSLWMVFLKSGGSSIANGTAMMANTRIIRITRAILRLVRGIRTSSSSLFSIMFVCI